MSGVCGCCRTDGSYPDVLFFFFFAGCILLRLLKLQKQVVLLAGIFWCALHFFITCLGPV